MSKIRINELARELEVKPSIILDLLPELGVTDKKTHSSSLDDDVVLNLRRRVTGTGAADETEQQQPVEPHQPARQAETFAKETAPMVARSAPAPSAPETARPSAPAQVESSEAPAPVRRHAHDAVPRGAIGGAAADLFPYSGGR